MEGPPAGLAVVHARGHGHLGEAGDERLGQGRELGLHPGWAGGGDGVLDQGVCGVDCDEQWGLVVAGAWFWRLLLLGSPCGLGCHVGWAPGQLPWGGDQIDQGLQQFVERRLVQELGRVVHEASGEGAHGYELHGAHVGCVIEVWVSLAEQRVLEWLQEGAEVGREHRLEVLCEHIDDVEEGNLPGEGRPIRPRGCPRGPFE
mmetsp:Transcript_2857/g.8512  ORF Transcript_2857/g.8512 Transcript_2857/m.8512 type:complete len:202 (+) Transcript_2857:260-865(+)